MGRDDGTWEYDLTDASTNTLRDIVTDPRIADTSGFDRTRLRVFQFAPDPNTNAWFYYLTLAMSPLALIAWLRGREHDPTNRIPLLATIVMAVWMQGFLMRSASESAVSDVSAISAVLGAWLVARGLKGTPAAWWRGAPTAVVTVAVLSVSLAALWRGEGGYQLDRLLYVLRSEGTRPIHNRLDSALHQRAPYEYEAARYVYQCTRPTDRLLLPWYGPDLIYGSGRGFAAGRPYFLSSLGLSVADQQFSLDRLAAERVPIVLANDAFENDFSPTFPLVAAHIRDHYTEVGTVGLGDGTLRVFVDRRLTQTGTFGPNALPCFAP